VNLDQRQGGLEDIIEHGQNKENKCTHLENRYKRKSERRRGKNKGSTIKLGDGHREILCPSAPCHSTENSGQLEKQSSLDDEKKKGTKRPVRNRVGTRTEEGERINTVSVFTVWPLTLQKKGSPIGNH